MQESEILYIYKDDVFVASITLDPNGFENFIFSETITPEIENKIIEIRKQISTLSVQEKKSAFKHAYETNGFTTDEYEAQIT